MAGYIPDDVSSVHSSVGGIGINSTYPQMFSNFQDSWPSLSAGRRPNGGRSRVGTESVAGESVAATESDINGPASTIDGGRGGVSLAGLSLNDAKQTSMSQSDRLKRYVESGGQYGRDDDLRSTATGFSSQTGLGNFD
jgi:regulator of nonsense transcripts 1